MPRPCVHTSHPNIWGIPIYAHSQTWYHKKPFDVISQLYTHAFLPTLWGIHAYVHSKTLHHIKTKHHYNSAAHAYKTFRTFGEFQYTCTPNIQHSNQFNQRHISLVHTYMMLRTFGELIYYKHSKYMPFHEIYSTSLLGCAYIYDIPNLWGIHVLHTLQIHVIS
jgi:hypothetical protein